MGAAVAVLIAKERHIISAFERAGAVTPERSRTPEEIGVDASQELMAGFYRIRLVQQRTPQEMWTAEHPALLGCHVVRGSAQPTATRRRSARSRRP